MTPKQDTEAGSFDRNSVPNSVPNSVTVETLESRVCLSSSASSTIAPMLQYAVRAQMRELAHVEYRAEQAFAYHPATPDGFRGDAGVYHDHDVRPNLGDGQHETFPVQFGEFVANFGGRLGRVFIIQFGQFGGDAALPNNPWGLGGGQNGGQTGGQTGQTGDATGGPTINNSYTGNPLNDPTTSPPPVGGKSTETPPASQTGSSDQTSSGSDHRHVKPSVETSTTTTTTTTTTVTPIAASALQTPPAIDDHALKSGGAVASVSHLAAGVLSGATEVAGATFTTRFASALKSLTPANFADLSVARLAGAGESTFLHSFAAVPTQAAARVEGVLADAVAGARASRPRFFEFTNLGSPFALLSDSMANFVEDSASLPMAVANAPKAGPWTLTATVVAADVLLLTYMYRRSQRNRRRYQSANGYAYSPFAS